jgi:hypothetical protein
MPPVGESRVIGNQVPARDDYLQCVVGSELLVDRDRMIPDWRWLGWRMGFSGEERLRAVVVVPADLLDRGVFNGCIAEQSLLICQGFSHQQAAECWPLARHQPSSQCSLIIGLTQRLYRSRAEWHESTRLI